MSINFEGRVAIVTGAGNGLGRSHALALAERGAKVVVNDLGGARDGTGASSDAAMEVVGMIEAAGGEAFAHGANVAKFDEVQDMVAQAMEKWGRVDILINNAGILRDKSFAKMDLADFQLVMDVHLMPPEVLGMLTAESVTAGALILCDEKAPTRTILCAGAGGYAKTNVFETDGIFMPVDEQTPEAILAKWDELSDTSNQQALESGGKQTEKFLMKAMAALKA